MKHRNIYIVLIILLILATVLFMTDFFALLRSSFDRGEDQKNGENVTDSEQETVPYVIEEVVGGLVVPWSIVFPSSDRILVAERPGRLRVIEHGVLREDPMHIFSEVSATGEEGLMSLALDPEYADNRLVYASLAYASAGSLFVKVVRFEDRGDTIVNIETVMDRIPAANLHAGCRIAFGPDNKLYITTGDATDKALAQDLSSLAGKILRINSDGSIPNDNPFPNSPVWSYGHRNPQGLAWHPKTGALYATEHGPSLFDGPVGGDEINHIEKGANYGWPLVSHEKTKEGTNAPLLVFTPAEAPASAMIYSGKVFPQFKHRLFFGALKGEGIVVATFAQNNSDHIVSHQKLADVSYGRIRDIVEGPDGLIYFSTSNRDGRGNPVSGGDRIYRMVPAEDVPDTETNGILEKSDLIILESPKPNGTITSPLTITGKARGNWFFEATFPVVLTNWDGLIIAEHYAQAEGEWMTTEFVPFKAVLEFENPVFPGAGPDHFSRRGSLILKKDNPSGLPEYDDAIEITVFFGD